MSKKWERNWKLKIGEINLKPPYQQFQVVAGIYDFPYQENIFTVDVYYENEDVLGAWSISALIERRKSLYLKHASDQDKEKIIDQIIEVAQSLELCKNFV